MTLKAGLMTMAAKKGITLALNHGTSQGASTNSLSRTLQAAVPAGQTLVVFVANQSTTDLRLGPSSISKIGAESATWTKVADQSAAYFSPSTSSVYITVWTLKTTVTWPSGTSITASYGGSTMTSITMAVEEFSGVGTIAETKYGQTNENQATLSVALTGNAPANGMILAFYTLWSSTASPPSYGGTATTSDQTLANVINGSLQARADVLFVSGAGTRTYDVFRSGVPKVGTLIAFSMAAP